MAKAEEIVNLMERYTSAKSKVSVVLPFSIFILLNENYAIPSKGEGSASANEGHEDQALSELVLQLGISNPVTKACVSRIPDFGQKLKYFSFLKIGLCGGDKCILSPRIVAAAGRLPSEAVGGKKRHHHPPRPSFLP
jgi:hypothetical protein